MPLLKRKSYLDRTNFRPIRPYSSYKENEKAQTFRDPLQGLVYVTLVASLGIAVWLLLSLVPAVFRANSALEQSAGQAESLQWSEDSTQGAPDPAWSSPATAESEVTETPKPREATVDLSLLEKNREDTPANRLVPTPDAPERATLNETQLAGSGPQPSNRTTPSFSPESPVPGNTTQAAPTRSSEGVESASANLTATPSFRTQGTTDPAAAPPSPGVTTASETPTRTPRPATPTATATVAATASPTPTSSPSNTPTATPTPSPSSTPTPRTSSPSAALSTSERQVFDGHNSVRSANNLGSLNLDAELVAIARERAKIMADNDTLSHYAPNGESVFDIMARRGFSYSAAAENIHYNNYPDPKSPQFAVESFLASPSHRANMLSTHFRRVGVGIVMASNGNKYYAVVFAD